MYAVSTEEKFIMYERYLHRGGHDTMNICAKIVNILNIPPNACSNLFKHCFIKLCTPADEERKAPLVCTYKQFYILNVFKLVK